MSTKPNTNLKAIELTQAELDSVAGGGMASAQAAMGQAAANAAMSQAVAQATKSAQDAMGKAANTASAQANRSGTLNKSATHGGSMKHA